MQAAFNETFMPPQPTTTQWDKLLQLQDPGWWHMAVAAVVVIVVIWVIVRLIARVNEDVDPADADREMLDAIHDLRSEGDLSEDEFRSIKGQLISRLGRSSGLPKQGRKSAETAGLQRLKNTANSPAAEAGKDEDSEADTTAQPDGTASSPRSTKVPESPRNPGDPSPGRSSDTAE
jgi:hypothetical protein